MTEQLGSQLPIVRHILLVLCVLLMISCQSQETTYFPLNKGAVWQYQVTIKTPHKHDKHTLSLENIGNKKIAGNTYYIRRSDQGIDYYLQKKPASGDILRVAKRTLADQYPVFDDQMRYVIKGTLDNTTEWTINSKPYLFERVATSRDDDIKNSITVPLTYRVSGLNDSVMTPAGNFENCLHIHASGEVEIRRVLSIVSDKIIFDIHEWYAPDVGLVMLTWDEQVSSEYNTGGSYQLQLLSFKN